MMKEAFKSLTFIILLSSFILISTSSIHSSQNSDQVMIDHPEEVRIDQEFKVEFSNLIPEKSYKFVIKAEDNQGEEWVNYKEFTPENEDYIITENEMMDLIQFMEPPPEITDLYYPPIEDLKESWQTEIILKKNSQVIAKSVINRTYSNSNIITKNIYEGGLIGEFFKAPDSKSAPGVVVLHGSEGRISRLRALMLAENGFNALAIQYFGFNDELPDELLEIPIELVEVPIELVEEAGNWLIENNYSEGDQVGLYGVSKGGELALLAGSKFDIFNNVVAMVPIGVVFEGISEISTSPGSSWSYQGEPVDYIPYIRDYKAYPFEVPREYTPFFIASFEKADRNTVELATIQVENIDGSILMVSGADDKMWSSVELLKPAEARLEKNEYSYTARHLIYDEAGHYILPPFMPTANREKTDYNIVGGNQEGYARADADHWPKVLETLRGE